MLRHKRLLFSRASLLLIGLSLGLSILDVANAQARHASSPELTDQERAWLAAGHRVRVRISDYPPYMIREPRPKGLAVDYLDHIAAQFDLEIEYVPANLTFAAAVADLAGSRQHYDVLPTFTRTPEREKQFAVSTDYLNAPWVIYTRQDSPYLVGLESLAGKTLAAETGFLIIDKLKRDVPDVNILEVPIALDALTALATGQADAYVGNLAVGSYLVKEHRLTNLMVAAPTHYGINTQAMAVRSDWPELASLINWRRSEARLLEETNSLQQTKVELQHKKDDCLVRFRVSDTGVGIPESKQETVFQPFQRLERHRSLPGVGLGLAIAQQLTTAMGGSIRLRSQSGPGSGSTFCFELRLPMGAQLEQDTNEDLFIVGYSGRRRTLLVADDQATSRGFLSECCRGWGFEVIEAADGAEAVACFQALETPVDAVLVDQFMPRLDGWGCLQALRGMERGRQLPVILFSAVPAQRPAGYPEAIRFDGFAMKPLTESTLARLLAESLALDWEYEVASSTAEAPQPDPALLSASLTAEERARLRAMVAMGQVIGLQQWAAAMAAQDVGRKPMWQGIEQLCRALDLQALQRLAAASSDD